MHFKGTISKACFLCFYQTKYEQPRTVIYSAKCQFYNVDWMRLGSRYYCLLAEEPFNNHSGRVSSVSLRPKKADRGASSAEASGSRQAGMTDHIPLQPVRRQKRHDSKHRNG